MNYSLNCFLAFKEAETNEQREAIVKKYKKGASAPAKGMIVYYSPALQAMKGRLCPGGTLPQILQALREKCHSANSTEKVERCTL